ncbi:hypothetical protein BD414DRAFT_281936 [Trametes punicea]|nr:hypothetical protein BD414DRAFT_281936 [Trametes punicea]
MIANHPLLSPELCGLPNIQTIRAPFFVALTKVLKENTFTDVFDHAQDERYSNTTLCAQDLKQVSLSLHRLASKYQLAVIILAGVRDTFPRVDGGDRAPGELRYSDQERWVCVCAHATGRRRARGHLGTRLAEPAQRPHHDESNHPHSATIHCTSSSA